MGKNSKGKYLLFVVLALAGLRTLGQIDSSTFFANEKRAFMVLKAGNKFYIREWGGFINGGYKGSYYIREDTLILIDVLNEELNTVRTTYYVMNDKLLKFYKDSVVNFDYEAKEFRQRNNIPKESKLSPPSLDWYGDFRKEK